jgi:hypothetical protein
MMARQLGSPMTPTHRGILVTEGGLGTQLPHKQIFSLFSYFEKFLD